MEVSVSLFDAAVASLANQASNYLHTGRVPEAKGSLHPNIAPYGETFMCKDNRRILLAIGNDAQFAKLCTILGESELVTDPRFRTNSHRLENRQALADVLSIRIENLPSSKILDECRRQHVPVGAIRSVDEVLNDPDVQLDHGKNFGGVPTFPGANCPQLEAPPHLGEHTYEILTQVLGMDLTNLAVLRKRGIIS